MQLQCFPYFEEWSWIITRFSWDARCTCLFELNTSAFTNRISLYRMSPNDAFTLYGMLTFLSITVCCVFRSHGRWSFWTHTIDLIIHEVAGNDDVCPCFIHWMCVCIFLRRPVFWILSLEISVSFYSNQNCTTWAVTSTYIKVSALDVFIYVINDRTIGELERVWKVVIVTW